MKLDLKKIRLDGDTQPRVAVNESTVAEYTEGVMNGVVFPPVVIFHDGSDYWLADGFHRYFAHKRAANLEIEADVRTGTAHEAFIFASGSNSEHGLPRTNEDKRRIVLKYLNHDELSSWSDSEIARITKISTATIHRVRKSLQLEEKPVRKFMKNGVERTMDVSKLVQKKPEPEYTHDPMAELASEIETLMEENKRLKEDRALDAADIAEEEKLDIHEQVEKYRHQIKVLETELKAVKRARDSLQNENAEMKKQVIYWKKRCEKTEQKAA